MAYQATLQGFALRYVEADTEFAHHSGRNALAQAVQLAVAWSAVRTPTRSRNRLDHGSMCVDRLQTHP